MSSPTRLSPPPLTPRPRVALSTLGCLFHSRSYDSVFHQSTQTEKHPLLRAVSSWDAGTARNGRKLHVSASLLSPVLSHPRTCWQDCATLLCSARTKQLLWPTMKSLSYHGPGLRKFQGIFMSSPAGLGDSSGQASCLFGLALCSKLFCELASEIPYSL